MKKNLFFIGAAALILSGCNSDLDGSINRFTKIVTNLSSFSSEVDEWNTYGADMKKNGIKHEASNASDETFVKNKMDSEYQGAIAHVGSAFTITQSSKEDLEKENQGYKFTYNKIMTVKDANKNNTLGYCVSYNVERIIDGEVKSEEKDKNNFIYIDKIKPLSVFTGSETFIKDVCADDFYNKYKKDEK